MFIGGVFAQWELKAFNLSSFGTEEFTGLHDYKLAELAALEELYNYVKIELISNPEVVLLQDLTEQVIRLISSGGTCGMSEIQDGTQKHIHHNLSAKFKDALDFIPNKCGKLFVVPTNISKMCCVDLGIQNFEPQNKSADASISN